MMWFEETWVWIKENIKLIVGLLVAATLALAALMLGRSKDKVINALIKTKKDSDSARAELSEETVRHVKDWQEVEADIKKDFLVRSVEMTKDQQKTLSIKKAQYVNAETEEEKAAIIAETKENYSPLSFVSLTTFAKVLTDED